MKKPKQTTIAAILIQQLILWPVIHVILTIVTAGIWLTFGWLLQIIDLCVAVNRRAKFAEYERQELLAAIREGKK